MLNFNWHLWTNNIIIGTCQIIVQLRHNHNMYVQYCVNCIYHLLLWSYCFVYPLHLVDIYCKVGLNEIIAEEQDVEDIELAEIVPANEKSGRRAKEYFRELEVRPWHVSPYLMLTYNCINITLKVEFLFWLSERWHLLLEDQKNSFKHPKRGLHCWNYNRKGHILWYNYYWAKNAKAESTLPGLVLIS